jgi:hypothetical protein
MIRNLLKVIAVILGLISLSMAIDLIPDRTDRNLIALTKHYPFEKKLEISENFTTDFESSYEISYSLKNPKPYKEIDSLRPYEVKIEIFKKNKPIKIFENNSFMSESGQEYELKLNFVNANSKPNTLNVGIQSNVPGPAYELLIEREYEWIFWIISGIIFLLALISGYFGFKKQPSNNNV